VDLNYLHLLRFEKKIVAKVQPAQLRKLESELQYSPDEKERLALRRSLIICEYVWLQVSWGFFIVALILQFTVGWHALLAWLGGLISSWMLLWRNRQAKRLGMSLVSQK